MTRICKNSTELNVSGKRDHSFDRRELNECLRAWRQRLGYFSIFAALPTILAVDAKAGGYDDCTGRRVPVGTYTAAAPFMDSGDTTGANNTVGAIYDGYYGYTNVPGPDHVYSFKVTATGGDPKIQVTATSAGYDPAIYILSGEPAYNPPCPNGTAAAANNHVFWIFSQNSGSTETLELDVAPGIYHLFIDSTADGGTSVGAYTIRMQDVTIAGVPQRSRFNFYPGGPTDLAYFRPGNNNWYYQGGTTFQAHFGFSTDRLVPADYDGDGAADLAIYRDGQWWIGRFGIFGATDVRVVQFGLPSDIPVPANYFGDARDEIAIYREGTWWMLDLATGQIRVEHFGLADDRPVPADYDGDGRADQAVYRNGEWHLNRSSLGYTVIQFGLPEDKPVIGDYDGDGKTDLAVFRNGIWYVQQSTDGLTVFQFGTATDTPVPEHYDSDGKTDPAIFRNGVWAIRDRQQTVFGTAGDRPIPSVFTP